MAKRKRLTPAQPAYFTTDARAPETKSMPGGDFGAPPVPPSSPIAQVAGDTATRAALDEVTDVLRAARSQGRMIEALDLSAIEAAYLVRDRMVQDDEDMDTLIASLRARGQQTPIEVTALANPGDGPAYGLISGWRRLTALNRLYQETGEAQYATIKALVITPASAQAAYVAMVEENEIRANLSLYERARIALRAAREGIYPTPRHAVLGLFGATSRAKRSKIGRFVALVEMLDSTLAYPTAIAEKLGLDLVKVLGNDAQKRENLHNRLLNDPPQSSADELRVLADFVASGGAPKPPAPNTDPVTDPATESVAPPAPTAAIPGEVAPGLCVRFDQSHPPRIELSGVQVDAALYRALKGWLSKRQVRPKIRSV
jgi:ParB family transcriptional regulator, chromosome partitioning protein